MTKKKFNIEFFSFVEHQIQKLALNEEKRIQSDFKGVAIHRPKKDDFKAPLVREFGIYHLALFICVIKFSKLEEFNHTLLGT